jgi:hypothetical protein
MWDPYDPSRYRPRSGPGAHGEPDEPWVAESGPRPPSAQTWAVVIAVVSVATLVSLFLTCVLVGELVSFFASWAPAESGR